jgi:hypothetical protein
MGTNKLILSQGIKNIFGALPLFFIGPVIINSAFKNQEHPMYFPILFFGILICFLSVFFMFRGLKIIMKAMFDGDKNN